MKKVISLSIVLALSVATVAEAKRGGGSRGFSSSKSSSLPAKRQTTTQNQANSQQNKQADATFNNTPNTATQTQARQASTGSTLANLATGAMAGYLLGDMLSPSDAQAKETTAEKAVADGQKLATVANAPQFKSIGGKTDPFLIEQNEMFRRYCLNGVQYLSAVAINQVLPSLNQDGSAQTCQIVE